MRPMAWSSMRSSLRYGVSETGDWYRVSAAHHEIPAGELLREPPELYAREDHLCSRGADIDPDRQQRDVVLQPQAGRGGVVLAAEIVVVVIVVRLPFLVRVRRVHAQEVILETMRALLFRDVGHVRVPGHVSIAWLTGAPPS